MKKYTTKQIGDKGETYAVKYLKKHKYKIITQNYRKPYGEIDIIAENKEFLIFVEVKTRGEKYLIEPSYAVNSKKQKSLRKAAIAFLRDNKKDKLCRFDVCEVFVNSDNLKLININYIEDAF